MTTDDNDDASVYARLDAALLNDPQFEALSSVLRNGSRPNVSAYSTLMNSPEYAKIKKAAEQVDLAAELTSVKSERTAQAARIKELEAKLAERGPV